ncbi:chitin deacetylase [Aspergillus mulundensis]|uniref:Putative Chitin deacetylase n=1 Tax=Aspergillus mulundensis TaxID=1810919 RepID=A0A3D8T749_9EURO|nr:putative Chitin deacetylase [Aspergillus mulundensis]RDW93838.1 putative Chitin deacetylase [Aspergillus mulundensis]
MNSRERQTVPIGTYIQSCHVPGEVALTFDDGPDMYTDELLDLLSLYNAKATFFVNGLKLYGYESVIQRIVREGHQLASHTYSHADLTTLGDDQITEQMTSLETALQASTGVIPVYMRPPYLAVNDHVLSVMADLGYHVIGASVDTKDYENDHPDLIGHSVEKFTTQLDQGGTIVLAHDIREQTVRTLVRIMLDKLADRGKRPTTVGACLGDSSYYR